MRCGPVVGDGSCGGSLWAATCVLSHKHTLARWSQRLKCDGGRRGELLLFDGWTLQPATYGSHEACNPFCFLREGR